MTANDSTESCIVGSRVGRPDDLMVFHQSFVIKEPINAHCLCRTFKFSIASALAYILRKAGWYNDCVKQHFVTKKQHTCLWDCPKIAYNYASNYFCVFVYSFRSNTPKQLQKMSSRIWSERRIILFGPIGRKKETERLRSDETGKTRHSGREQRQSRTITQTIM